MEQVYIGCNLNKQVPIDSKTETHIRPIASRYAIELLLQHSIFPFTFSDPSNQIYVIHLFFLT